MSDAEDSPKTPPKKVKRYVQYYCKHWENEEAFKGWLTASKKGPEYFYCKCCLFNGKGGRTDIAKHSVTQKHKTCAKSIINQQKLTMMNSVSGYSTLEIQTKKSEILLSAFSAEHNIPFDTITHLTKLIPKICPDSEIAKNLSCGKTKSASIVKYVIGATEKDKLINILKSNYFSLICDESTDRSTTKHMALVARTVDCNFNVSDYFLALLPVEGANAEQLYNIIKDFFDNHSIDYKKYLIGFAADGANVMMGKRNSVATRLQNDVPFLFVMKCICHSFHHCASYACKKLPSFVEQLARDVYNYLNGSPKRLAEYFELQTFLNIKPHKILQPAQTRWLSLLPVVKRLLEQYESLKLFFTRVSLEDDISHAKSILKVLNNPLTILYLEFLEYVLPVFDHLNREMQSESPKLHLLHDRFCALYRQILSNYITQEYLNSTSIENVQFRNPTYFLNQNQIYLGGKLVDRLLPINCQVTEVKKKEFITHCLDFYVEAAFQIYKRFPLKDLQVIHKIKIIDPKEIFSTETQSIVPLATHFKNIVLDKNLTDIDNEFRMLKNSTEMKKIINEDVSTFWQKISSLKYGNDNFVFPLLSNFVKGLLCLPHSSANVERIFSSVNVIKTKQRNSLNTESLEGILHSKTSFKKNACYNYDIQKEHLNKFNQYMYDFKKKY